MTETGDRRKLIRQLTRNGYTVTHGKNMHWKIYDADGQLVGAFPSTPGDHRSLNNTISFLKQQGIL
ncbi:hypothetical protein [Bifidobacterium tissieri]|uniref:Type II toxin-antitoxin system HicA family toxin n=1 Tax=Bifidobacterium tissieri TaxID=1630162 RepID=A0A5M9ZWI1_9BIFI|nr:hypothetical protein [Bifidobacterium tissieri]KAA8828670.1 hypothetical protein EM849_11575 [Bifidobacterium tissieri]KAA8831613.1 hypothetical protein EMO89_02490 [Bifidobacterium tissieri]